MRGIISFVLLGLAGLAAIVGGSTAIAAPPGYAAILVDADTREVLYANEADSPRHPASITKIMTLYLAFEALSEGRLKLTDQITMTAHAAAQAPSKLGLLPGRSLSVDDAIRVMAVKSANDVAVALAEHLGGSEPAFARLMTQQARALGMRNTTFMNATGLPNPGHITTARDISILSLSLIRDYPRYYTYFGLQSYRYDRMIFANHNHLLGRMPGMDGIKTGYTVDSGFTLAASAVRDGHRLVAVVLGEPSLRDRDRDVTALMDTGFAVLAGRIGGQPLTVASLLSPVAHPALRAASLAGTAPDTLAPAPRAAVLALAEDRPRASVRFAAPKREVKRVAAKTVRATSSARGDKLAKAEPAAKSRKDRAATTKLATAKPATKLATTTKRGKATALASSDDAKPSRRKADGARSSRGAQLADKKTKPARGARSGETRIADEDKPVTKKTRKTVASTRKAHDADA